MRLYRFLAFHSGLHLIIYLEGNNTAMYAIYLVRFAIYLCPILNYSHKLKIIETNQKSEVINQKSEVINQKFKPSAMSNLKY